MGNSLESITLLPAETGTNARESSGRIWPYTLAVLLLPVIVLWHSDNMLFPFRGQSDPWVYLGFFRNLENFKRALFPGTYYGSRLSWILVGSAIHSLFSPVAAYYVLHLLVHSVATVSLFTILRLTAGVRKAFLATMVFCVNPLLWQSTGSDYVDGVGIAYCLLAMALLTRSAVQPVRKWSLLLAGAALAGAVYSNLVWVALAPLLPLHYAALAWIWHRTSPIRSLLRVCLWLGAGLVIVTVAFGIINYRLDGEFWFYAPSLKVVNQIGFRNSPFFVSIWVPQGLQPWLWYTVVATVTAVFSTAMVFRTRQNDSIAVLFSIQFLLALAFMGYMQNHGTALLGLRFYASYLLPWTFLVIGASFWTTVDRLSQRTYVLTCCGSALIFGAIWFDYAGHATPIWPDAIRQTAWAGGIAFAAALILRQRIAGILLALAGCAIFTSELRFTLRSPFAAFAPDPPPASPHAYRGDYARIMRSRDSLEAVRKGNPIRFWFNTHEPAVLDYHALNATYLYQYTWFGADSARRACDDPVEPGGVVVVMSRDNAAPEVARRALTNCWAKLGITPVIAAADLSNAGDAPYTMAILRADAIPSVRQSLQAVFDSAASKGFMEPADQLVPFRLEGWSEWVTNGEKSTVRRVPGGFAVRTPDAQYAWGAMYAPLVAPSDGRYRFALKYKPQSGRFAFGGYAGDSSHWLAVTSEAHPSADGDYEMAFWVELKRGETILLRIENANATGNHPASLLMEQLTAIKLDP